MKSYSVVQLIIYALSMKDGKSRAKFTARILNTADEISLTTPAELNPTQIMLIFNYESREYHQFEMAMAEIERVPTLTVNRLMICFDHSDENPVNLKTKIYQAFHEGRLEDFTSGLRQFAQINEVFIAERVRFVP